ncbi:hypothetical protein BsWGS_13153 [Bradybaena similaris]
MASKTCTSLNLVRNLVRLKPSASPACAYRTLPRAYCRTGNSWNFDGSRLQNLPGNRLLLSPSTPFLKSAHHRKLMHIADKTSWNLGIVGIQEKEDFTPLDETQTQQDVAENINKCLEQGDAGRLFAVVSIRNMQHKVTTDDILIVRHDFPPNAGDRIRLEKVLAVGGKNFSLIGQPLLRRDVVRVEATVVEKTLSHNRVWFVYRKRKNFKKFHLYRDSYTILVINSIQVAKIPTPTADDSVSSKDLTET